jgi:hypothetical protein
MTTRAKSSSSDSENLTSGDADRAALPPQPEKDQFADPSKMIQNTSADPAEAEGAAIRAKQPVCVHEWVQHLPADGSTGRAWCVHCGVDKPEYRPR